MSAKPPELPPGPPKGFTTWTSDAELTANFFKFTAWVRADRERLVWCVREGYLTPPATPGGRWFINSKHLVGFDDTLP